MNARVLAYLACFSLMACVANTSPTKRNGSGASTGGNQQPDTMANDPNFGVLNPISFTAVPPSSYVNKIKVLLTGLPASANDIAQGSTQEGLGDLIDTWMASDAFEAILFNYLGLVFQQNNLKTQQFAALVPWGNPWDNAARQLSFPRTAMYFIKNKIPFNQLMYTTKFMVTLSLLQEFALIENFAIEDNGAWDDQFNIDHPGFSFTIAPTGGAANINELLDPQSPNYMKINYPSMVTPPTDAQCGCNANLCGFNGGPIKLTKAQLFEQMGPRLASAVSGGPFNFWRDNICTVAPCDTGYFNGLDGNWRLVEFDVTAPGELPLQVYDLPTMATASKVKFRIPRVGFFSTIAFLGQWTTNINNQARSTINQTMIVGLNKAFDGSDQTMPTDLRALPQDHAAPGTSCYGCHLTMDPMRQYFRQAMTVNYHLQKDPNQTSLPGAFAQAGVAVGGGNLLQLGQQIANSPLFAPGWAAKVCMWLNSGPCAADDPEILRIAKNFEANNFDFLKLIKDVAMSPLTTYSAPTKTALQRGTVMTLARRDQFCQSMSARLGISDVCNLNGGQGDGNLQKIGSIISAYPADGYSRASVDLLQPTTANFMSRIGLENVCSYIAEAVVDTGAGQFQSKDPNQAIGQIVTQILGVLPPDDQPVVDLLTSHYNSAMGSDASATEALRSVFVLACLSPYVSQIGL